MAFDASATLRDERDDWMHFAQDLQRAFRGNHFDQPLPGFTRYEGQIIRLLARHDFVRYEQIVEALRDNPHDLGPTPGSTKTMISRIRNKLDDRGAKSGIKCSWGAGWYATDRKALKRFVEKISPPVQSLSTDMAQAA